MSKNHTVSRRYFLTLAAATAAGCATKTAMEPSVTREIPCRPAAVGKPIRVGVIGCGARGMQLINEVHLAQPAPAVIAAVCDAYAPRRIQAQKVSGADVCPAWEQLVARTDIEAVIIATPDHWHAPIAIAAMESGKDVYCERPMALTIEEAKAFRDSAVRTKRVVQIGAQEASESRWLAARALLQDNAMGALRWSQADGGISSRERQSPDWHPQSEEQATPETLDWRAFLGNAPERAFAPERFFQWRKYWDYSFGIAADFHYPELAALLTATGPAFPERVSVAGGIQQAGGGETPDSLVINADYPGGHTVVLAASLGKPRDPVAVIRGRMAALDIRTDRVRLVSNEGYGSPEKTVKTPGPHSLRPIGRLAFPGAHLDDWLECIRSRGPCVCNEEIGYRAMVAVGMAVEAYLSGATICFNAADETRFPCPPRVLESGKTA